ncbi:ATP-binding protein [Tumebacillus permanentifrigoris]|uniref:Putative AbiEii toxin of type IV toxin-antitoxin system n=1 Tax=Tumebacillus permanentifrigoris TaxID=378543 RepID=A0A316DGK3_9BACL|nr:ATP-binding protein [Tumebacillus permanentifrigoris]PWK16369.1 putative AbiEii toxin of type IV toxin-antitoxin system [Tumebacillus permanentifrigoris]
MRIEQIYTREVGPLPTRWSESLVRRLSNDVYKWVLLTGPNGSGKSTVLKMIANLWILAGQSLDLGRPKKSNARTWLQQWGGCAIVVRDLFPDYKEPIGIVFGDQHLLDDLEEMYPNIEWVGETVSRGHSIQYKLNEDLRRKWRQERQRLLVGEKSTTANMIYLDSEERRWITPRKNVGEIVADDSQNRWLTTYQVTEHWKGQLESSLINLKIIDEKKYRRALNDINGFLIGKRIDPTVHEEDNNRLRVIINNSARWHTLDELSAGEHQLLILIFIISRWLETGGVVLIDEPDLYLHPSQVSGLLGYLETLIQKRHGQLILTSHQTDVWSRYKAIGKRIILGAEMNQTTWSEDKEERLEDTDEWLD